MSRTRFESVAFALAAACSLGAGSATTDRDAYTAAEPGIATFHNSAEMPLYLPGCAPFVFERSLEGGWVDIGPPYLCVWEGIAVAVGMDESLDTVFDAPSDSGIYRLRYAYGARCEMDVPLSEAQCQIEGDVRSNPFEVQRESCDPAESGCQFRPAAPNILCADGTHVGGPASECTMNPASGECGYEILSCPSTPPLGGAEIEVLPAEPTEVDEVAIRVSGTWPDSCVPMHPKLSINAASIRIDTANFGEICLDALTPWSETVSIGGLEAGDYEVIVANAMIPGPPETLAQAVFAVPEPLALHLEAAAALAVMVFARQRASSGPCSGRRATG
jgi:hypothetical protein